MKHQAWRAVVALASLAIFVALAAHGHWATGVVYALVPVVYVLTSTGRTIAGVPLQVWFLIVVLWSTCLLAVAVGIRELFRDLPLHLELAGSAWVGAMAIGGFALLLSIYARRHSLAQSEPAAEAEAEPDLSG